MKYIQFSFLNVPEQNRELLLAQLSLLTITGMEEQEGNIHVFFEEMEFAEAICTDLAKQYQVATNIKLIEEENWNETWEQNFQPLVIDGFCSVRAYFHPQPKDVLYDLIITPKMSFGTGHHATTELMITMMKSLNLKEQKVFDYGTGTGILAILAEKLGAKSVFAIDIDKWSVENAMENFKFNNTKNSTIAQGMINKVNDRFNVILANINRTVLVESMAQLRSLLEPNGLLLLSGILLEDQDVIEQSALSNGFILQETKKKNNWMAMLFHKEQPNAHVL